MMMQAGCRFHLAGAWLLLLLGGCAGVQMPPQRHLQSADAEVRNCAEWFGNIDAAVDAAGVRDREASAIEGYPYLRSTRFLAALGVEAGGDERKLRAWLERLRSADQSAREAELRNLTGEASAAENQSAMVRRCATVLMAVDLADAESLKRLHEPAQVPDAYEEWMRIAGLYPLTRIPFAGGVAQWHEEAREMFRRSRAGAAAAHPVERYGPRAAETYSRSEVAALLGRAAHDPLGIPKLTDSEQARLLATYAPVFEVETTGDYDKPGALHWGAEAYPLVDIRQPLVYQRLVHTRYHGRTLLQLVYTMWFGERPADHAFDMLAGKLDGLVWRVTLGPDGAPLLYDTMHPCGCFHMFLPTPAAAVLSAPDPGDEWAFIPAQMPAVAEGQRIRLRIATRSHYLLDAGIEGLTGSAVQPYVMQPESMLRSLPLPSGGFRSIYGADALVPGSERPERMLFWPMGIPSAGAMRQWGNHATAFLGRRHFDDADLIERRFDLKLP